MRLTERARVTKCVSARLLATFTRTLSFAPGRRRRLRRHIEGRPGVALCGALLTPGGITTGPDKGVPAEPCATCGARALSRSRPHLHVERSPGIALCGAPLAFGTLATGAGQGSAEPCATCHARAPGVMQRAQRSAKRTERKRLREQAKQDRAIDPVADDAAWEWLDG